MAHPPNSPTPQPPDVSEIAKSFAEIAEHSQNIANEFLTRTARASRCCPADDLGAGQRLPGSGRQLWSNPMKLAEAQMQHVARLHAPVAQLDAARCWARSRSRWPSRPSPTTASRTSVWENNFLFDYIKQSYLIAAENIQKTGGRGAGARPADRAQGEVLHPPVRGRAGADQLRVHQPGGAEGHGRIRRQEPDRRPASSARRTWSAAAASSPSA